MKTIAIEFNQKDVARSVRSDPRIKPLLAEEDDARTNTVELVADTPESVLNEVELQAAETRAEEAEKYGQVELTEAERERIDFTRTNIPTARAAKGIAVGKGVDDFVSYFDPELTVDEHRQIFESAATEGGGQRGGRDLMDEREVDKRIAQGQQARAGQELGRAKEFAFEEEDTEARSFLRDEGPMSEIFDISFTETMSGGLAGRGEDFDRLKRRHERRSQRAQTIDEQRAAQPTRDPFEWYDNPDRFDYPGIDTVQPMKLHESRSERAREVDENELAPIAETDEQWAMNPDQFDLPGIDTPDSYSGTGGVAEADAEFMDNFEGL